MKYILSFLSSTRLTFVLLLVFGISIALATFIENDFGTESARKLVYNAKWFEVLLVLGCFNIIAVVHKFKLSKLRKISMYTFHVAFVFIIMGAGITRYFGNEGSIHIREGQTTGKWITTNKYVHISISDRDNVYTRAFPLLLAPVSSNRFSKKIKWNTGKVTVQLLRYTQGVHKTMVPGDVGNPYLHLVTTGNTGRSESFLKTGDVVHAGSVTVQFVDSVIPVEVPNTVQVFVRDEQPLLYSNTEISRMVMSSQEQEVLAANTIHPFIPGMLHSVHGTPLVLKQFIAHGVAEARHGTPENPGSYNSLLFRVFYNGVSKDIHVFSRENSMGEFVQLSVNGIDMGLRYGPQERKLPFQLRLNDFILKRYPGSESPSWYESNVQLLDAGRGIDRTERVYMNHILKHRGYRFYQSSYDTDERGTVLSINRDGWGTTITYLGYLLMTLGMLLSLVNKNSRFVNLLRTKAAALTSIILFCILGSITTLNAQSDSSALPLPEIPVEHAREFGTLKVQDNGGRIEPMNTLASEVLRKVSRVESYKGQTPGQVLLGMIVYPEIWQYEPMVRIGHNQIRNVLGIATKKASFADFFNDNLYGGYKLRPYVEQAYQKKPAYRSKFDNEIIRVDERVNISYLLYSGAVLKIFPDQDDTTHTWHSPLSAVDVFTGEDSLFTTHILPYYTQEVKNAMNTGNWDLPDEMLKGLRIFQDKYGEVVMPSTHKMTAEVFYNNADLFNRITHIYLLLGLVLLILQLIKVFLPALKVRWFFNGSFGIIAILFLVHTFGLALRWYVSGHAPWSNGYEALIFIAWATVLAGVLFYRKSEMAISATAVLAGLILQTAHLSWMDPQITNLVPVLQSYWLIVHVAVITASYGFLGLGALLAVVNLLLLFFQNTSNFKRVDAEITQLQSVIETTLIAGLYLLSIGTFLGGVWANESWGRYWAWDPKETWALITIIVYAVILHLRIIPGLKGRLLFTVLSLWGFGSVIMTYFGVNYYLSGLHSYAAGDPLPVPPVIYYSVGIAFVLSALAWLNQIKLHKAGVGST